MKRGILAVAEDYPSGWVVQIFGMTLRDRRYCVVSPRTLHISLILRAVTLNGLRLNQATPMISLRVEHSCFQVEI